MSLLVRNLLSIAVFGMAMSCSSYKQNIMFKIPEEVQPSSAPDKAEQDYTIQKNDLLYIDVFSNNGEKIIDPNPELTGNPSAKNTTVEKIKYLVAFDGKVKLPMINEVSLEGLTLRQAEVAVQNEYARFFKDPYVAMEFVNKRAILLGATGGKVVPLDNQNMRLTEVLALGSGLDNSAKAQNIRVLRGDEVYQIDLSTVEGYRKGDIVIQPGDIIYVEPVRKPLSEATRDYGTLLSVLVSLASLIVIIVNVN